MEEQAKQFISPTSGRTITVNEYIPPVPPVKVYEHYIKKVGININGFSTVEQFHSHLLINGLDWKAFKSNKVYLLTMSCIKVAVLAKFGIKDSLKYLAVWFDEYGDKPKDININTTESNKVDLVWKDDYIGPEQTEEEQEEYDQLRKQRDNKGETNE